MKYDWTRYWSPPDGEIDITDDGFLRDPMSEMGRYTNANLKTLQDLHDVQCLILLGEPGIGKTHELKSQYQEETIQAADRHLLFVSLSSISTFDQLQIVLENDEKYIAWSQHNNQLTLFFDSFDEGMFEFKSFARSFVGLLAQHAKNIDSLRLRVSCRTAVWPTQIDSEFRKLWGKEKVRKYELAPLMKQDVIKAAEASSIDTAKFLIEIKQRGAVSFAYKPITLEFLIQSYSQNESLPVKKSDIYAKGCDWLIKEPDPAREKSPHTKPTLNSTNKLAIAERVAIASLVGGKSVIVTADKFTYTKTELDMAALEGNEKMDGHILQVGKKELEEVLNTGLFSSRGDDKLGWVHQTYAEFMAAKYIVRHKLEWAQVQSLLFHDPLKTGTFQAIPQLYGVCAWLASLEPTFFDHAVLLDPEFLLLSDENVIMDSQKETLVEQLLTWLEEGKLYARSEILTSTNYKKLYHPNIASQLESYIRDFTMSFITRSIAIEIASACGAKSLEKLFVEIALDHNQDFWVRIQAIIAIGKIGSNEAKQALKPLSEHEFKDDPEDELKGVYLYALWPDNIPTKGVFNLITRTKKTNLWGAYRSFIENLASSIRNEDVEIGLDWIEKNAINARDLDYTFRKLSDEIMLKAWENISSPIILKKFARISYARLEEYEEIIGERAISEDIATKFQAIIEADDQNRRRLIKQIIQLVHIEDSSPGRGGYVLLHPAKIRLIFSKDLVWLVNWLLKEKNEEIQKIISEVIARVFDVKDAKSISLVFNTRKKNAFLSDATHFWFQTVELNSETAKNQREQWKDHQSWQTKGNKDENEEILKAISPEKIVEFLEKSEGGDMDYWWQVHKAMCMYVHEYSEYEIQKLPGWKVIDKKTRSRIIDGGRKFLLTQESRPDEWLGKKNIYHPAWSGYRAMKMIYAEDPEFILKQDTEFWVRWAPITIGFPLILNDPKSSELVTLAYKHAPDQVIKVLDVLIDEENEHRGSASIIGLLEGCLDERLCSLLLSKVKCDTLEARSVGDILQFLLRHQVTSARDYVRSFIKDPLPEDKKGLLLVVAVSFFWTAKESDWDFLWELVKKDTDFGRELIKKAHDNLMRGSDVSQNLNEKQLANLYIWLMQNFPPNEYFRGENITEITAPVAIADWRDSMLGILMQKGTPEAYVQLERVANEIPELSWIKDRTLPKARKIILQTAWEPAGISEILEMNNVQKESNKLLDIVHPHERDCWYERSRLFFRLKSGSLVDANFSRSKILKKTFEVFLSLWEKDGIGKYTRNQVITEYARKFNESIEAEKIGHDKANIMTTIIPEEIKQSERFEWRYDRSESIWIFKISPLN